MEDSEKEYSFAAAFKGKASGKPLGKPDERGKGTENKKQKIFTKGWKYKKAFYLCTPLKQHWQTIPGKVKATFTKNITRLIYLLEGTSQEVAEKTEKT